MPGPVFNAACFAALGFASFNLRVHNPELVKQLSSDPLSLLSDEELTSYTVFVVSAVLLLSSLLLPSLAKAPSPLPSSSSSTVSSVVYPLADVEAKSSEKDKFMVMFKHLKKEMLDHMSGAHSMPAEAVTWVDNMIEYNVVGGKLNRGITVLAVQRTLKAAKTKDPKAKLTSLETARASVLGWAIEWLQAFFLVADDVMDDSEERRGNPCW
ncbi:hypothetical protein TeGR_g7092 [Tetraparma gracilis]|uniref:Uncharacterized protein n=1 Tax=Tetraparma gracilis TaxID=2962635 RepID=A0ABQ6MY78_9STRA|nr:hypothetical protein TeGR_g7092 [Tetraparma gracilis]